MSIADSEPSAPVASDAASATGRTPFGVEDLGPVELFVLLAVAAHLVLPSHQFEFPTVSRTITLFLLAPLGLFSLVRSARRSERASAAMIAFLVAATISGVFAASPVHALRGDVAGWMSVAVYAAAAGWWALGRRLDDHGREAVPVVMLAVLALNALLGLVQVMGDIRTGPLATIGGRAHGLLDNPVFYGTLWAGACGWLLVRAASRTIGWWTLGVGAAAFATGISGSRAATGAVVLAGVVAIAVARTLPSIVNLGAAVGGLAASSFFARQFTSSGTLDRVAANPGSNFRVEMWQAGLRAFPNRPLFGHGFDHFSTAVDGELSLAFLQANQFDDLTNPTRVPHNFAVLLLVSVGLVGTLLFVAWFVLASRGAVDAALMVASLAIAATWALQPASQHSLPIAMLLFGAAVRPRAPDRAALAEEIPDGIGRTALTGGVVIGVLLAGYVGVGMYRFDTASAGGPDELADAAAAFPGDGQIARAVSVEYEAAAARGEVDIERAVSEAIRWAEREVEVAPAAQTLARIARLNLAIGRFDEAGVAIDRALDLQRWNPNALEMRVALARETGDTELLDVAMAEACIVRLPICAEEAGGDG